MKDAHQDTIIVVGGAGNIGSHIVLGALKAVGKVAVPSRSRKRLDALYEFLAPHLDDEVLSNLHTFHGDILDERRDLAYDIMETVGEPTGVVSSLGHFRPAPSLLEAPVEDLEAVFRGYAAAHLGVAQRFLPGLKNRGGTFVFINGPLAFDIWPGSGSSLVSIATAAQHMLFRALAVETDESPARVLEFIVESFVRDRRTQPGSPYSAVEAGRYVASLLMDRSTADHGESIYFQPDSVAA